jgi:hypothetical protein
MALKEEGQPCSDTLLCEKILGLKYEYNRENLGKSQFIKDVGERH